MADNTPSVNPYWRRLADLRPRLHDQAKVTRQEIRGRLWFVVENALSGRQFRLTPEAWHFVGLLDGSRTVEEALEITRRYLGEVAPEQDDVVRLLDQLHSAGTISSVGIGQDTATLYERAAKMRRRKMIQQTRSPLAIRIPLIDPDRALKSLLPAARVIFSSLGFVLWLAVVAYGIASALVRSDELTHNFVDRVLSGGNVALMLFVFALMKLLHEFGHGMAVKRWGGEVHDMGIMVLVFFPIPYVDATSANSFPSRLRRIIVSAAGMYVEIFLAATAIIIWSRMEPGVVRAALYNAALVGSVSTLFFNANPLLRFDGYYIFSDLISIPNLGSRGKRFVRYVAERYLLRLKDASTPEADPAERRWLFFYAVAGFCYRILIVTLIAFVVAQKFFFVGVALAIWAVAQLIVLPVFSGLRFLAVSPRLRHVRPHVWLRVGFAAIIVGALVFVVPAPQTTFAQGVIWVPEEGEITALTDGFVRDIPVAEGAQVRAGEVLIILENEELRSERERLAARKKALEHRYNGEFVSDRVAIKLTQLEIEHVNRQLADLGTKLAGLNITAAVDGRFALAIPEDLIDRFVRRGDRLGFVIPPSDSTVRVAVDQNRIGLIRDDLKAIEILSVVPGSPALPARIVRAVPAATTELPSMALSTFGGGEIDVVADAQGEYRALEPLFHFVLKVDEASFDHRVGQKVYVKFVHGTEPVGLQVWRRLRQLFLRELNV